MHKEYKSHISDQELKELINLIQSKSLNTILILGRTGIGKSSLAKRLVKELEHNHLETDKLYWKKLKGGPLKDNFPEKIKTALKEEKYICEGLWKEVQKIKPINEYDLVIHLKLPFKKHLKQLILRDIKEFLTFKRLSSDTIYFLKNR